MPEGDAGYKPPEADVKPAPKEQQPHVESSERLTNEQLFTRESELMRDKSFLVDVAATCDESYRMSEIDRLTKEGKPVEDWLRAPLFSVTERLVLLAGATEGNAEQQQMYDKAQQKLGMGLSGFYALSEGLGMAAEDNPTNDSQAHDTLNAIIAGNESPRDRNRMSRLAHATWAAAQPFRNRETRGVMQTFDTLPPHEKHKDMVQIRAAGTVLANRLTPAK